MPCTNAFEWTGLSERHRAILEHGVRGGADDDDASLRAALDAAGGAAGDRIGREGANYTPGTEPGDLDGGAGGQAPAPTGGPEGRPPAAPPAPPGQGQQPPAPPRAPDPNAVRDDMPYRDAAQLRREMAEYRDRYAPFEQAFGALPDDALQRLRDVAPAVGEDITTIAGAFANLHPEDRKYLAEVIGLIKDEPQQAAEHLARAAQALGAAQGGAPATQQQQQDDWVEPGPGDVMTRADWERLSAQEWEKRTSEQQQQAEFQRIDHELGELGYNLGNETPQREAEIMAVMQYASRTGRSLADAHKELFAAWGQQSVDTYVEGKRRDGGRRPAPTGAGAGASPSGEQQLETLQDGMDAMLARLDGAGVQGRRRAG